MKLVQLTEKETIEIKDVPARREPEHNELLIEPLIVGLTGVDAFRYRKGAPVKDGFRTPHIPGSECVGRVVSVGRGVDSSLIGKRVVASPISPCLRCEWCEEGNQHLCPHARVLGRPPVPGVLQERFTWPVAQCAVVPDELSTELAVHLAPLSQAIYTIEMSRLPIMGSVAVVGCGHLGLLLIEALRATRGGKILAVDILEYRREAALRHGATVACDPWTAPEIVSDWPRSGVDVAIDVSNASEGSRTAVQLTRLGGRVLVAGLPNDNRIIINAIEARDKELDLQFVRRPHASMQQAVDLMLSGKMNRAEEIITHRFPLDEIEEAYRLVRKAEDEVVKVLIDMPASGREYTKGVSRKL